MYYNNIPFRYTRSDDFPLVCFGKKVMNKKYPWELLEIEPGINSFIHDTVSLEKTTLKQENGPVHIEQGASISNSIIEGPTYIGSDTVIGPDTYIRQCSIGENCRVGSSVEVKNSQIMNNSNIAHISYIGDSVLGSNVNIGAGTCIANVRHDNQEIKTKLEAEIKNTKRKKLGAIIGDCVKIGINNSIYPGTIINPFCFTAPDSTLKFNVGPATFYSNQPAEETRRLSEEELQKAFPKWKNKIKNCEL